MLNKAAGLLTFLISFFEGTVGCCCATAGRKRRLALQRRYDLAIFFREYPDVWIGQDLEDGF